MGKKIKLEKPKGKRDNETVAEWYERVTELGNLDNKQRLGSLQDQSTAVINGVTRQSNE